MKYYIISGEASGDLHGSNLIKAIKRQDANAEFRCWGGDLMEAAGGSLVKHYKELAFMGFVEVLFNLRTILKNIAFCKKDISSWQPDALILIDYPGFNMRIAKFAKAQNLQVFYYISPQIWAWKQSRVKQIKQTVDKMFVILPFEKEFYSRHGVDVEFVGHPLLDAIENLNQQQLKGELLSTYPEIDDQRKVVAVLPGSRKQEIKTKLPIMLSVIRKFPDYLFVIAAAPGMDLEFYRQFRIPENVTLIEGKTYNLLAIAHAAMVTSGTATLETALFQVPEVVCYKGSYISYHIARRLIKVKFISLVNLIMDREIVRELIQHELNANTLTEELQRLTVDESYRSEMLTNYQLLIEKLGGAGASENVAKGILAEMEG